MKESVKLVECPRDAMQGIEEYISIEKKVDYINALLKVGFHTIDFGSFVSPKVIPQLRDTVAVLDKLELNSGISKLLAIVANERGAHEARRFDQITYLGYPFSVSEIFQKRNTNKTIAESYKLVNCLFDICDKYNKQLVIYLSMCFGNPYREKWNVEIVEKCCEKLIDKGAQILSLSDTIGISNPDSITYLFSILIPKFPDVEFGVHLHVTPSTWRSKIQAAYESGCRRFDSTIKGYGGCPMADDKLIGNMPTEKLLSFINELKLENNINSFAFENVFNKAGQVFPL